MKIAVLDVGHWHAPLARFGLERLDAEVVAVSTRDAARAAPWVARFGCRVHPDAQGLLALERPDFAFVFDRHRDLPATARAVIERGIACSIEKPGGVHAADVASLIDRAQARRVFASVPFVNRLGPFARILRAGAGPNALATPLYLSFVDVAGSPLRYPAMGCDWMLDPALAGGGCLINLGIHFVDLFAFLRQRKARFVGATLSDAAHRGALEDHARVLLDDDGGGAALIEVGYAHPDDEERLQSFTAIGQGWLAEARDDTCRLARGRDIDRFACSLDAGPLYADYVAATLDAAARGAAPVATLADLHAAMIIVDAAYASRGPRAWKTVTRRAGRVRRPRAPGPGAG